MRPSAPADPTLWQSLATAEDTTTVQCPFCFEQVEIYVDPATAGTMVQDCEVCCHPWQLTVQRSAEGALAVQVEPL